MANAPHSPAASHATHGGQAGHGGSLAALSLGALGVVFGDIGTSPLYTLQQCLTPGHEREQVLGVLSLIFWALTFVVTVKYLTFIMRADNRGEGGILALLALIPEKLRSSKRSRVGLLAIIVIAGAALLYGDGIITPAISVLSAVEGLKVAAPSLKTEVVVAITCAILVGLFAIQSRGTGTVGKLFGPVMILWFVTIGGLGVYHLARNPAVLEAVNPAWAVRYFADGGPKSFWILGSVVLAVTGGEALYADMGHFGAKPIRVAWLGVVFPALVLCYFGQGALVLAATDFDPKTTNPFFEMVPAGAMTYALVGISTLATIIASQALISGAFSLTHQAVQLGFFPRVRVEHTSRETEGQIYVPAINWGLMIACVALVLGFQASEKLAAAYGIAVSGTMAITSIVFFVVTRHTWGWPLWKSLPLVALFLAFDIPFFLANTDKFFEGGFVPIIVGVLVLIVMVDWKVGRSVLGEYHKERCLPLDEFLAKLDDSVAVRVPGTAVVLASAASGLPPTLMHQVRRIKVLHEKIVLVTLVTDHVPTVVGDDRLSIERLPKGFFRVVAHTGFMERPKVPAILEAARVKFDLPIDLAEATYYLGRETFLGTKAGKMGPITEGLFSFLSRNARDATSHFSLPPDQVVELGSQIDL